MKRVLLIVIMCCSFLGLTAQDGGFIYIETEPSRPFFVRTRDSIYRSSEGNFLLLAPLTKNVGEIVLGFPGSKRGVLSFKLTDTTSVLGLILKEQPGEGWRLVDGTNGAPLGTRRLSREEDDLAGMNKRSDSFAIRLSQVMNDSTVLFYRSSGIATPVAPRKGSWIGQVPAVKLISKKDMGTFWQLEYEVREGEEKEIITIEIDKPEPEKPGEAVDVGPVSAIRRRAVHSQDDQVFYRSSLPGR